jgi:type II secretory pathway pseudopilin PulG
LRTRPSIGLARVEFLITVFVVGTLTAFFIPQFSEATAVAKELELVKNLHIVRVAIADYYADHGRYPDREMVGQLTGCTTSQGFVWQRFAEKAPPQYAFDPYLQQIPANPIDGSATVYIQGDYMPKEPLKFDDRPQGYLYSVWTGEFRANTPGVAPSGIPYFDF